MEEIINRRLTQINADEDRVVLVCSPGANQPPAEVNYQRLSLFIPRRRKGYGGTRSAVGYPKDGKGVIRHG